MYVYKMRKMVKLFPIFYLLKGTTLESQKYLSDVPGM